MGKIKTVALGDEKAEEAARKKAKEGREQKKLAKKAPEEPVKAESPAVEKSAAETPVKKETKAEKAEKLNRGKAYLSAKAMVDKNKNYPLSEAITLVKKTSYSKFDGAAEVHINTLEKGIRGIVNLPHGTGKAVRVKIADEALIAALEKGAAIDFDILVAKPAMMAKLAKVAKILGPKGLMPNPKTGTISENPDKLVTDLSQGQTQFKSEQDFPIIHSVIGRVSFDDKKLSENFQALVKAIGRDKISSVFLKATMGPAVKVQL